MGKHVAVCTTYVNSFTSDEKLTAVSCGSAAKNDDKSEFVRVCLCGR